MKKTQPSKNEIDRVLAYLQANEVVFMVRLYEKDNTLATLDEMAESVEGEYTIHDWLQYQSRLHKEYAKHNGREVVLQSFKKGWKV